MEGSPTPLVGLPPELRQRALDLLCEAFADDHFPVEEFERRVDGVHAATTVADLRSLLADIPAPTPPARVRKGEARPGQDAALAELTRGRRPSIAPDQVREQSVAVGILGGASRRGAWVPARTNWVLCLLGGAEIDLREAPLAPGVTEVRVMALLGGAEIIVPPDVRVECSGGGILGGFEEKFTAAPTRDPEAPLVRVSGLAMLGGISVTVRLPGETAREAKRRGKVERRERRRLGRGRSRQG